MKNNAWNNLVTLTTSILEHKTWKSTPWGLTKSLSSEPFEIKSSNLSTPLKKVSLKAKPKWIIPKQSKTSYIVKPLILLNLWKSAKSKK